MTKKELYKFYEESAAWWRKQYQYHAECIKEIGDVIKTERAMGLDTKRHESERRQLYRWRKQAFKYIQHYITRMNEVKTS